MASGPENFNKDCSVEDTYSRKVSISVADAGETALVVSMVGGRKLTEEPNVDIPSIVQVDKELKTKTFILTSEDNSQKVATPFRENSKPQLVIGAQELELSLSCDTSSSFPSNCLTHSEVKTSDNEQMDRQGSPDGIKSSLGNIVNESHISNTLYDNNSDMGVHLGLSVGSFLSGNFNIITLLLLLFFFLIIYNSDMSLCFAYNYSCRLVNSYINLILADDMNNSGTEDLMNEDVKQDKPSEECISEGMLVFLYYFIFSWATFWPWKRKIDLVC